MWFLPLKDESQISVLKPSFFILIGKKGWAEEDAFLLSLVLIANSFRFF